MRKLTIALLAIPVLTACGGGESEEETDLDTVTTIEPLTFEEQYSELLSSPCDCDLNVSFEVFGEGQIDPVLVNIPDSGEVQYYVEEGHLTGFDGNETFNIDVLSSVDSVYQMPEGTTFYNGMKLIRTSVPAGNMYEWPDETSEIVHTVDNSTYSSLLACYDNWIQIMYYTPDGNKEGWIKK